MNLGSNLRICRHNIPPFIPLARLVKQSNMQTDVRAFLYTLSQYLNAYVGRKQQLHLIKVSEYQPSTLISEIEYSCYLSFAELKICVCLLNVREV